MNIFRTPLQLLPLVFLTFLTLQCSGQSTITNKVNCSSSKSPPVFTRSSYYHKVLTWPRGDDYFEPNPPILATLPDNPDLPDYGGSIRYRMASTDVVLTDNDQYDPRMLLFTRTISPEEGRQLLIVDCVATRHGTTLTTRVPLIIELPPIPRPEFRKPWTAEDYDF